MNVFRRVWVAGLLGMWMAVCWSQEATEENAADTLAQQETETQVRQGTEVQVHQEAEVEGGSPVADATAEPDAAEQAESMTAVGQTVAGTADAAVSLDERFSPSLDLRADEPWDNMPVDF